jgi:gamma-glutamyltranspeptidase
MKNLNKGCTKLVLGLALLGATVLSTPALALDQSVVSPKAMIVAGHPLAVESGLKALRAGGSACDAFVATAATLSLTLTDMMGPLGSGFALIHKPGDEKQVRAIDFNGVAPLATDISKFASMEDKRRGILAPTVPGNLKGWEAIHQDCGRLPWADLWADAIDYAENGWPIDTATAFHIGRHIPELAPYESWGEEFLDDGEPPKAGSMQRRPELAASYKLFAELGSAALYNGPVGEKLVAFMEKEGGLITQEDLDAYEVIWSDPIQTTYDNYTVYGAQPGSSSVTWMEILKIVEGYDLQSLGHNTPEYLRILIEATKHAYQHGYQYVGDPKFHDVPVEKLLSAESAAEIRAQIDATPIREFAPYDVASLYQPPYDNHATSHMVIVDEEGNMISSTNTLGTFYGMGMVVEGTGLLMSNGMDWFDIGPNIWTGEEKSVLTMEAGKRNRWTLAPGMIFEGDKPYMLVGGAGAEATMWGIAQPILNAIEFGMDPQKALDAPRFRYGDIYHYTGGVNIGLDNAMPASAREGLVAMGYPVDEPGKFSNSSRGTTQMLVIDPNSGALWGGAAPDGRDFVSGY